MPNTGDSQADGNSIVSLVSGSQMYVASDSEDHAWSVPDAEDSVSAIGILLVGESAKTLKGEFLNSGTFEASLYYSKNIINATRLLDSGEIDICIVDAWVDGHDAIEVLEFIRDNHIYCESIIIDNSPTVQHCSQYFAAGATDVWRADAVHPSTVIQIVQNTKYRMRTISQYREEILRMSEHLANMAHELKNPLNAIKGFNSLLVNAIAKSDSKRQKNCISRVDQNVDRINFLINEMLDLSSISLDKLVLSYDRINLNELISEVCDNLRPFADSQEVELCFPECEEYKQVLFDADPDRLYQVISNLISNGLKYTEKGTVSVSIDVFIGDVSTVEIAVTDTGIGIRPQDFKAIFNQFQQVSHEIGKKVDSTGLGLSITLSLVKLHGGRLSVESEFGVGSKFVVTLPLLHL